VAFACPRSEQQLICPGDRIADTNGYTGHVLGVNGEDHEASISYDAGYANAVLDLSSLAIQEGCIGSVCVGDRGTDNSGHQGRVIALNPNSFVAVFKYDSGANNGVIALKDLALSMGCLENYCAGDTITDANGYLGKILAINYFNRNVSISYEAGYANAVLPVESLSLTFGCVKGDCVKDKGTDSSGLQGSIIAVNPYSEKLIFKYNSGANNGILSPGQFLSADYCSTYGDSDRTRPSYFQSHGKSIPMTIYTSDNSQGKFLYSSDRK
jgi:hypothetical protein